jgi:alpha-ketoglutarate-dependent taurine dioxygenase
MVELDLRPAGPIGAEVLDVDADRLRGDDHIGDACLDALEEHGVLVFRGVHVDDSTQVAFCRKLGEIEPSPSQAIPEVTIISLAAANPIVHYIPSSFLWHIDGIHSDEAFPSKATVLSAHAVGGRGDATEFASTYTAYDELTDDEKDRFAGLRVVFTLEQMQRQSYPEPTPEQLADWRRRPDREHPLVWRHESGRRSLVVDVSASHIAQMDFDEGRALVEDLLGRMTRPDRVFRHHWSVGDMVVWDNRGLIHRALPYDASSPREMHRTEIRGDEPFR